MLPQCGGYSKYNDSYAVPGRSSSFSNIPLALLSAFWHTGRDDSGPTTRSM